MSDLIDKQAAINIIAEIPSSMSVCSTVDECHGMKRMQGKAIRAIDSLPSIEEVIDEWQIERCSVCDKYLWIPVAERLPEPYIEKDNELPSVKLQGYWITAKDVGDCCYRCSKCRFIRDAYILDIGNYCPNCGAKME